MPDQPELRSLWTTSADPRLGTRRRARHEHKVTYVFRTATPEDPLRVCFVCLGNICRSPMAEAVFRSQVAAAGLADLVRVDSAGTGDWHVGDRADPRALDTLRRNGYDGDEHRARQFEAEWFADRDLIIALDRSHLRTLTAWADDEPTRAKIHLLRNYDPDPGEGGPDVPDPYYDGGEAFSHSLRLIEAACEGLLNDLRRNGSLG